MNFYACHDVSLKIGYKTVKTYTQKSNQKVCTERNNDLTILGIERILGQIKELTGLPGHSAAFGRG